MAMLQLALQAKKEEVPQHSWGAQAVQAAAAAGGRQVGPGLELQAHRYAALCWGGTGRRYVSSDCVVCCAVAVLWHSVLCCAVLCCVLVTCVPMWLQV